MKNSNFGIYVDFGKSKIRVGAINKDDYQKKLFF